MDFAILLSVIFIITGIAWFFEKAFFLPKRKARAQQALYALQKSALTSDEDAHDRSAFDTAQKRVYQEKIRQPWWLEYTAGFFPVVLLVFVLRSFIIEPFKIPSGSMIPTLQVGDFILVNKFAYGLRLALFKKKIISLGEPQRGDVMVFYYPGTQSSDYYIKRVIGLPGDLVTYRDKRLSINNREVHLVKKGQHIDPSNHLSFQEFSEQLGSVAHKVIYYTDTHSEIAPIERFPFQENCIYGEQSVSCKVPQGHYFVMGDNRDGSADSRYWGFVPEKNVVGKAFFIWLNLNDFGRIGKFS